MAPYTSSGGVTTPLGIFFKYVFNPQNMKGLFVYNTLSVHGFKRLLPPDGCVVSGVADAGSLFNKTVGKRVILRLFSAQWLIRVGG